MNAEKLIPMGAEVMIGDKMPLVGVIIAVTREGADKANLRDVELLQVADDATRLIVFSSN